MLVSGLSKTQNSLCGMNNSPIGIFDSGLGGLSVWAAIRKRLPAESLIYYGDGKNCPYGRKSAEQITEYAIEAVERLLEKDAKLVVVACNTATGAAVRTLRERYPSIPIVGMEPAVKPAALATRTGVIGILATQRSLDSDHYRHTSACYASGVEIVQSEGEGFVELVESGQCDTEHAFRTVERVVGPMLERGVDQIVLGCTHYPFLKDVIQRVIGERDVKIIDPSPAIAARVEQLLVQRDLLCDGSCAADYEFISAATDEYVAKLREFAYRIG